MHYQVSRNGQMYGPYTLEDLQRYLASGNVLPTDLTKSEEMADWVPVSQLLSTQAGSVPGAMPGVEPVAMPFGTSSYADPAYQPAVMPGSALAGSPYADAPNLNWGLVLLFGFLTCGLFMIVWNLVTTAWLRRVQPNSQAMLLYVGVAVLFFIDIIGSGVSGMHTAMTPGIHHSYNAFSAVMGIIVWVAKLVARFNERSSLEEHFNGPEPVGLRLSPVMTFFFGGIYFQYHLNRINAMKQAARYGAGRTF